MGDEGLKRVSGGCRRRTRPRASPEWAVVHRFVLKDRRRRLGIAGEKRFRKADQGRTYAKVSFPNGNRCPPAPDRPNQGPLKDSGADARLRGRLGTASRTRSPSCSSTSTGPGTHSLVPVPARRLPDRPASRTSRRVA